MPVLYKRDVKSQSISERDLIYKVLFDMKKDINDLKKIVADILPGGGTTVQVGDAAGLVDNIGRELQEMPEVKREIQIHKEYPGDFNEPIQESEIIEESLSIQKKEVDLIKRALEKHNGKRKSAARELGISERTLYRKIKEYDI